MNPHIKQPTSPLSLLHSLAKHQELIVQMAKREVIGRYKGSLVGLFWSFFNPVLMLAVYTFFFTFVFKSRWGEAPVEMQQSRAFFTITLFAGMIVHSLFAEVVSRSPTLVLHNPNYVKKVVFPLEILPIVSLLAALFHAFISLSVLVIASAWVLQVVHWTLVFLPLVWLPLLILIAGLAWFLSSLGVFIRDVGQTIGLLMTILMFLSPVFYPVSSLPTYLQPWMLINPLTFIIEQTREVVILGHLPNFASIALYTLIYTLLCWLGYVWFQKTRHGFAEVL